MDEDQKRQEISKQHFENAYRFAGLSMQAWNFHIIGTLGIAGWAATEPRIDYELAIIASICLAGFLAVTGWNAKIFGDLAKEAVDSGRDIVGNDFKSSFDYLQIKNENRIVVLTILVDIAAIFGTFFLFIN